MVRVPDWPLTTPYRSFECPTLHSQKQPF